MMIPTLRVAAAVVVLGVVACGEHSPRGVATDSTLTRDLALAGQQTAQPTFQDTAVGPGPIAAAKARSDLPALVRAPTGQKPRSRAAERVTQPVEKPVPSAQVPSPTPGEVRGEIGTGTGVALTSGARVCTSTNLPGDKLVATVTEAVVGSNGAVIPAGSAVVLEVASLTPGQTADAAHIVFRVRSIVVNDRTYNVAADVAVLSALERAKVAGTDASANRNKVIGGAIAGALIGRILGHSTKGTIIGAAAGAATGAAVAKSGERWEGCLPAGAQLRLTLNGPIVM